MKAEFSALIRAGRVLDCFRMEAATDIYNTGKPCSIFIAPIEGGALEEATIVTVAGVLAYQTEESNSPVVLGDWSPCIYSDFKSVNSLDGNTEYVLDTDYALFVAPIAINER